ncbi:unnamed protein product [Lampetra fluviatilis]
MKHRPARELRKFEMLSATPAGEYASPRQSRGVKTVEGQTKRARAEVNCIGFVFSGGTGKIALGLMRTGSSPR